MALTSWTTDAVAPDSRFAYWHDAVCRAVLSVDAAADGGDGFDATIRNRRVDRFGFARFRSSPHRIDRSPQVVRRAPDDRYLVSLQLAGSAEIAQGDHRLLLQPTELAILSAARPFSLSFRGEVHRAIAVVPRPFLEGCVPGLRPGAPRRLAGDTPALRLLRQVLLELSGEDAGLSDRESLVFADSLAGLLGCAAAPGETGDGPRRLLAWPQVAAFVAGRLDDPELSPAAVAAHFRVSPRTVHNVFADRGERFAAYLIAARLERARRDLAGPRGAGRGIAEIAYASGFKTAAHFSRAFRDRFGTTPRAFRDGGGA